MFRQFSPWSKSSGSTTGAEIVDSDMRDLSRKSNVDSSHSNRSISVSYEIPEDCNSTGFIDRKKLKTPQKRGPQERPRRSSSLPYTFNERASKRIKQNLRPLLHSRKNTAKFEISEEFSMTEDTMSTQSREPQNEVDVALESEQSVDDVDGMKVEITNPSNVAEENQMVCGGSNTDHTDHLPQHSLEHPQEHAHLVKRGPTEGRYEQSARYGSFDSTKTSYSNSKELMNPPDTRNLFANSLEPGDRIATSKHEVPIYQADVRGLEDRLRKLGGPNIKGVLQQAVQETLVLNDAESEEAVANEVPAYEENVLTEKLQELGERNQKTDLQENVIKSFVVEDNQPADAPDSTSSVSNPPKGDSVKKLEGPEAKMEVTKNKDSQSHFDVVLSDDSFPCLSELNPFSNRNLHAQQDSAKEESERADFEQDELAMDTSPRSHVTSPRFDRVHFEDETPRHQKNRSETQQDKSFPFMSELNPYQDNSEEPDMSMQHERSEIQSPLSPVSAISDLSKVQPATSEDFRKHMQQEPDAEFIRSALEMFISNKQGMIDRLDSENEELTENLQKTQDHLNITLEQKQRLYADNTKLTRNLNETTHLKEQLERSLELTTNQWQESARTCRQQEKTISELTLKGDRLTIERDNLMKALSDKRASEKKLIGQRNELTSENLQMKKSIKLLEYQVDLKTKKLELITDANQRLEEESKRLSHENNRVQESAKRVDERNVKIEERNDKLNDENSTLKKSNRELSEQNTKLTRNHRDITNQMMLEKTKRQKVENELKKSQNDRQKFLAQSQNQQTELKKMKDHVTSLEAKLLRLERDAQRQKGDQASVSPISRDSTRFSTDTFSNNSSENVSKYAYSPGVANAKRTTSPSTAKSLPRPATRSSPRSMSARNPYASLASKTPYNFETLRKMNQRKRSFIE